MKKTNVIILIAVFVLLVGCYVYINYRPIGNNNTDSSQKRIELSLFDSKKIKNMTLVSNDSSLEIYKNGDNWVLKGDEALKLDQYSVSSIATSFANLYADRIVDENPKDLKQYGLDPVQVTATATLDDGTQKVIYLGSKTPQGDSYYMLLKGDPKLYILSSIDGGHFAYQKADLVDKTLYSVDSNSINYIKILLPDGRVEEIKKVEKGSAEEKQYAEGTWIMTKPYETACNENVSNIVNGLASVIADSFVSDNPADFSKYGFDKPLLDVSAKAGGSPIHLIFGKNADDSSIYLKTDTSNNIYKIGNSKYDLFSKQPFDLIQKFAYIVNIDNVDQIIIEQGQNKYIAAITRQKKPAEKQGEADQVVATYMINGKTIEESSFKDFYQSLIGLTVEAENDKQLKETPEVKTTFILNKGEEKQVTISYSPYNDDFYAVFKNGKADFLISKDQIKALMDKLKKLVG